MNDIFLYISLGLAILWAVRMAQSKRRNPIVWAGVTFGLMLIPTLLLPALPPILGMAPLLILVFLKPKKLDGVITQTNTIMCPKCRSAHTLGYNYCVNCGWELSTPYQEATPSPALTVESTIERSKNELTGTMIIQSPENHPVSADTPQDNAYQQDPITPPETSETVLSPRPTTATGFTDLGLSLFEQRRFREAIDQFTKAIALNASYIPAWQNRAESYKTLGLLEKSLSDTRQVEQLRSS
jgi:tetratricopeptide (TPR) repeat protein